MPEDLTPDQQGENSGTSPSTPPAGQPVDWENRYKGLQREYNKLDTAVKNKDAVLTAKQQELDSLKTAQGDAYSELQTQHTTLQTAHAQTKTQAEQAIAKVKELEGIVSSQQAKSTQRAALIAAQGSDLLEAFEAGDLNIAGLEGDALTAKLTSFRGVAAKIAGVINSGTTPQTPALTPTSNPLGMTLEQLQTWLQVPANEHNAQFEAMNNAYYTLVSKQQQQ